MRPMNPESLGQCRVFGVDFSGARDAGKRIWIAAGSVVDGVLRIAACLRAAQGPGRHPLRPSWLMPESNTFRLTKST